MDLVKTQITLSSMKEHSMSTLVAMSGKKIKEWIGNVDPAHVKVKMVYIVPKDLISDDEELLVESPPIPADVSLANVAKLRQVPHVLQQLPFVQINSRLEIVDSWPSIFERSKGHH